MQNNFNPLVIVNVYIGIISYMYAGLIILLVCSMSVFIGFVFFWEENVDFTNFSATIISLFNTKILFVLLQSRQAIIIEVKERLKK